MVHRRPRAGSISCTAPRCPRQATTKWVNPVGSRTTTTAGSAAQQDVVGRQHDPLGLEAVPDSHLLDGVDRGAVDVGLALVAQLPIAGRDAETGEQAGQRRRAAVERRGLHHLGRQEPSIPAAPDRHNRHDSTTGTVDGAVNRSGMDIPSPPCLSGVEIPQPSGPRPEAGRTP